MRKLFSRTLEQVEGNARPAGDDVSVDEYRLFASPVVLGGGTRYFPAVKERIDLELIETRTFRSRVVYLRYGAGRP